MRALLMAGVSVCSFLAAVGPVAAQDHVLFSDLAFASLPRASLTFDGITPFAAVDTGWVSSNGEHMLGNQSYFTGTAGGVSYNSYFSFALGALRPVSPYLSAILTLQTGNSIGQSPFDISFFDVDASLLDLGAGRSAGDATGQVIYADLGSGASYGSYTITASTSLGETVAIPLNQTFIAAVNSGLLTTFSIGGTLTPTVVTGVPEPASFALLGIGMAGVAAVRRRRAG